MSISSPVEDADLGAGLTNRDLADAFGDGDGAFAFKNLEASSSGS